MTLPIVVFYTFCILCFQVAIHSPLRSQWIVQLINTFGIWLYLPLVFLIAFSFLVVNKRKAKIIKAILLIPTLIFILEYNWAFLPHWRIGNTSQSLRVMTWNVWHGNPSPERIRDTILKQKPDVVALQELVDRLSVPLQQELKAIYPYQEIGRAAALGIFSRYPLQSSQNSIDDVKKCRCQEVTISWKNDSFRFVNVHLPTPTFKASRIGGFPIITAFNSSKQDRWLNVLMERIKGSSPLLVVGDFNIGDRQPNYSRVRSQLKDSFFESGWGFGLSYPVTRWNQFPLFRIDYVFHSNEWTATQTSVRAGAGSDHKFVTTNLHLNKTA